MAIRIKSYKGKLVADMTREQLIEALTDSVQHTQRLLPRHTTTLTQDKIEAVFEAFEPGWKKFDSLFDGMFGRKR